MRQTFLFFFCAVCFSLFADELVRNGDFAHADALVGALPPEWQVVPAGSGGWSFINDDGVMEVDQAANAVLFTAGNNVGDLQQRVSCQPNTDYWVGIAMKANGCVPGVQVIGDEDRNLVNLIGKVDRHGIWEYAEAKFNSGKNTQLTVRLRGSVADGTGTSVFDQISILPVAVAAAKAQTRPRATKDFVPPGENIALHKPYTMSVEPRCPYCTDDGDKTQLTDGAHTQGYFWVQKSTVGWRNRTPFSVTIDLGKEEPISGVSWSTAGGTAGVNWLQGVYLYVSSDQKNWFYQGDLTVLGTIERMPPERGYGLFKYATGDLQTKGRWVKMVLNETAWVFCDEIEVYRGKDAWLEAEAGNEKTADPLKFFTGKMVENGVRKRLQIDLLKAEEHLIALPASSQGKTAALAQVKTLRQQLPQLPAVDQDNFIALVPFNALHEQIFALNATCLQAAGFTEPFLWHGNRWENLLLTAIPPAGAVQPELQVLMMRGEVRSEALNICNPTNQSLECKITAVGLPAAANLILHEVLVTDTHQREMVAAALQPTANPDGSLQLQVPAGCSRQVWLSFHRPDLPDGKYAGRMLVSTGQRVQQAAEVHLQIAGQFPKETSLHIGGWDYLSGHSSYFNASGNMPNSLPFLQDMYMESPWGKAIPRGAKFDDQGHLTNADQLDFSEWDDWMTRWPEARLYCVDLWAADKFNGEPMGTERFNRMVGEYITAWAEHMKKGGLQPEQLVLLLLDEPRSHEQDRRIINWGKAIKAANTGVRLFEDPIYENPEEGLLEMFELCDILCPKTTQMMARGERFQHFYLQQQAAGRELWLYSCSGPSRHLDPETYYRAQKWYAFMIGAKGSFYWAFGCGGGIGDSWKPYLQTRYEYSPYFVSQTDVMAAKQSEAIREGIQDYEYLVMLKQKIKEKKQAGGVGPVLAKAEKLLAEAPAKAIAAVTPGNIYWSVPKKRSLMDEVRMEILQMLAELQ